MHTTRQRLLLLSLSLALGACSGSSEPSAGKHTHPTPLPRGPVDLSIVGTNDLHGHIEMLPLLGGYLDILREKYPDAVLLIDAGDMFQGTLESNTKEGAPIVEAYNLLGYQATTLGNHEFDFGPVGPDATVQHEGQDPRGALKARAAEAHFPFLSSNVLRADDHHQIDWTNVRPNTMVELSGVKVGLIGASTFETPHVTLAANFKGLEMAPLASSIAEQATQLRKDGAQIVVVTAHSGGVCKDFSDPDELASCKDDEEIFQVARELPAGLVDVIVAGHTHQAVAHRVNGIAIIESYSRGAAFGRIDIRVDASGEATISKIYPPHDLCQEGKGPTCTPGSYEGHQVTTKPEISALAATAAESARELRQAPLGVSANAEILRSRSDASSLGNLFVDLMLAAQPSADIAINNGGSLRADLPAGELNYGDLFEAMPFDNRFAIVTLKGKTLRKLIETNLQRDSGILSLAGMTASASCKGGTLEIQMRNAAGKLIKDGDTLRLVTSDFVASGGDGLLGSPDLVPESVEIDGGPLIRDAMAAVLKKRGGELDGSDPKLFDPKHPRLRFPGTRPVLCSQ